VTEGARVMLQFQWLLSG